MENTTVWITATLLSVKMWSPVYVDQGITIQNGISIGMNSAGSPNQYAETASISQNGKITTQGTSSCQGDVFAPNIYNKTQVDFVASFLTTTITSTTSFNANNVNATASIHAQRISHCNIHNQIKHTYNEWFVFNFQWQTNSDKG